MYFTDFHLPRQDGLHSSLGHNDTSNWLRQIKLMYHGTMQRLPNWFCGLLRAMARHPSATGVFLFSLLISRRVWPLRSLDFNHRTAARWKMHLVRTARTCRGGTKTYIISLGTMLISPFGNFRRQPFPTLRQHPLSFFFILIQLCGPLAETLRLFFFFFSRFFKLE